VSLTAVEGGTRMTFERPPTSKDELWEFVRAVWGVTIPRTKVCDDHVSPFDAFAEGYFGNASNWVLWYGSRGTGKSLLLATLALTKSVAMDLNVILLGGSMAQSQNVQEHVNRLLRAPNAPTHAVARHIKTELRFHQGNWITPIPASQTTVRGPHPALLCLDEIDEMEKPIYDASMGQAMAQPNAKGYMVNEMTVASSTWQNPIGTFQEVRDDALLKGLPVRSWCWREVLRTAENPEGWMEPDFIERKQRSVSKEMFRIEYDLGEPRGGSRAFDPDKVKEYFVDVEPVREHHKDNDDLWVFEEPQPTGTYCAAADWAKETDKTSISIFRTDLDPAPMVYQRTLNRQSWPDMVAIFNKVINEYHAMAGHDATGVGNVVNDLVDERVLKVILMDQRRKDLLNEYVSDFEQGRYRFPKVTSAYNAHRATTMAMIWAGAATAAHIPDEIISCAIANRVRRVMPPPVGGVLAMKSDPVEPAKIFKDLDTPPPLMATGDVVMFDEDADGEEIAVFSLPGGN
jgi:hypothetical protein